MFMEILYKQTALFPLSSCRYKAAVTFFIDRLKHLAELPPLPPPVNLLPQPTHASRRELPSSKEPPLASRPVPASPAPGRLPKARMLTAGSFPCWWFCWGQGRKREKKRVHIGFPSPPPYGFSQCLLRARRRSRLWRCSREQGSSQLLEELHADDTGRP